MHINHIQKGTTLFVSGDTNDSAPNRVYETRFYETKDETSFYVEGIDLYNSINTLKNAKLKIHFLLGATLFSFFGKITDIRPRGNSYLTLIEQVSLMQETSRRKYDRHEMKIFVKLYGLREADLKQCNYVKADNNVEFSSTTFDVSLGGICMTSNVRLRSQYEPYFLAEFVLNEKEEFLLPLKLTRSGNCPQTVLFKYDYGFQFIYDEIPQEEKRLATALFSAKLSLVNR